MTPKEREFANRLVRSLKIAKENKEEVVQVLLETMIEGFYNVFFKDKNYIICKVLDANGGEKEEIRTLNRMEGDITFVTKAVDKVSTLSPYVCHVSQTRPCTLQDLLTLDK